MKRAAKSPKARIRNRTDRGAGLPDNPDASTAIDPRAGKDLLGGVSLTKRIAAISRWRDNYNPLRGLTLQRAVTLAEYFTRGWMADLQWTYFYLEQTDPDLFALCDRRTSRLLEMDYVFKQAKDADKTLAEDQAGFLQEKFDLIDNLYEAVEHLAMASFRGFAHCEKWYDDSGNLSHFEIVDQWSVVRDGLRGGWKYNPRAWQTAYFGLGEDMIIDPANFLIRDTRRHIDRLALFKMISANLAQKDWDAFVEIYGIPSGVVIGPPNINQDKVGEFQTAAEQIAEGGSGFLPNGSTYHANEGPRGNSPFKERLEYLTEKLILVGTGGMLTMLSRSGSGTLAGNAHAEVFEQLAKAEAKKISELFNRQIVAPMLKEKYPNRPAAAYFDLAAQEETKIGEVVAHIGTLAGAGYQVDPAQVQERTGYTVTLKPAGPTPKAAGGSGAIDGKGSDPETGDAPSIENRRIRNSRHPAVDSGAAVFDRHAIRQLTQAQTDAVLPLLDRIAALKELPADGFAAGLKALRADLPRLFAEARLHSPDIASIWEQVLGTALVDGLADLPTAQ